MRTITLQEGQLPDASLLVRPGAYGAQVQDAVRDIIKNVRERGDEAVAEYTQKFDNVKPRAPRVSERDIQAALRMVPGSVMEALSLAAENIADFHARQLPQSWFQSRSDGSLVGSKVTPLDSVGIYVPGGQALYPSTVLMNAIPARVAGVRRIAMATPPNAQGTVDPVVLAAAHLAGVTEIHVMGGAQAIAAMAYGTQSIAVVDKITGPGNAYVACAKRLVAGDVGIDMIAGPSEVLILADETAEPSLVAIDLMAQAEHDANAACYVVTTDPDLPAEVEEELKEFLLDTPRAEITRASLDNNGIIFVAPDLACAVAACNAIAPEHLEVHMDGALELLGLLDNAGAIFLGQWTPESVGDYVAGPNHTLPTNGTSRFSSPLSTDDFIKKTSVISYSMSALNEQSNAILDLADVEGLWAHGKAVRARFELLESEGE
jgi:histidinol dehydrogenase